MARRGLRATRLRQALAVIEVGFSDPEFSPGHLARNLGVSVRYVQNLLYETGRGFTDRVRELRLLRARAMLADPGCQHLRIAEIASICGFNEVPYFNRCFRHRFGVSPTDYRSRSD
jgi:AraC-like DNA-binding protein